MISSLSLDSTRYSVLGSRQDDAFRSPWYNQNMVAPNFDNSALPEQKSTPKLPKLPPFKSLTVHNYSTPVFLTMMVDGDELYVIEPSFFRIKVADLLSRN